MKKPITMNAITMCERALEASNWTAYDSAIVVDNKHVVCFKSTARTTDSKSLLRSLIDAVNRNQDDLQSKTGIVVFEEKHAARPASVVGVISATPKDLERQYINIRKILKPMGLCEDVARRLFPHEITTTSNKVTIESKYGESASRSLVQKTVSSIGTLFKVCKIDAESSRSQEMKSSRESTFTKTSEVDSGAVRSALLINMISKDMGVDDLKSISTTEAHLRFYETIRSKEALHYLERRIQNIDKKIDVIKKALIRNIEGPYVLLKQKNARGLYDNIHSDSASESIEVLGKVAENIAKSKIDGESFNLFSIAQEIVGDELKDDVVSHAIDYCVHGTMLLLCFEHAKKMLVAQHEKMQSIELDGDLSIVSSSLGFPAFPKLLDETNEDVDNRFVMEKP